jgi:hypothetical protein
MRCLLVFLFALTCGVPAFGSPIPTEVAKTIVFIYTDQACTPQHAYGTGFLMGISVPMHPDMLWIYLVTAQHVLHKDGNDLSSPLLPELYVRVNKKSGESSVIDLPIRISGPSKTVFLNNDADVDIAVLPIQFRDSDQYDLVVFPEDSLTSADDMRTLNLGVGTEMFFTGMFAPFLGQRRNEPIVRFGKLAMIPDEKIDFGGHKIDAYLVETFSFGGNSGSPVFSIQLPTIRQER